MIRNKQGGFTAVEVILILAVLAILAFVGWRIYDTYSVSEPVTETTTTDTQEDSRPIEDADGLSEAEQELNDTDIDSSLDTGELDDALEE